MDQGLLTPLEQHVLSKIVEFNTIYKVLCTIIIDEWTILKIMTAQRPFARRSHVGMFRLLKLLMHNAYLQNSKQANLVEMSDQSGWTFHTCTAPLTQFHSTGMTWHRTSHQVKSERTGCTHYTTFVFTEISAIKCPHLNELQKKKWSDISVCHTTQAAITSCAEVRVFHRITEEFKRI